MERLGQNIRSMNERYIRQTMIPEIGEAGQEKLKNAKVLIVGIGGLGSPISLYLTAAGVGQIGLIDNDIVSGDKLICIVGGEAVRIGLESS